MKERAINKERVKLENVGVALFGFLAGFSIIDQNLAAGTVTLLVSYWILKNSRS